MSLKHAFTSPKADGADTTQVRPSNWNDEHVLTGIQVNELAPVASVTIAAGYGGYVPDYLEIVSGTAFEIGSGAVMEVG